MNPLSMPVLSRPRPSSAQSCSNSPTARQHGVTQALQSLIAAHQTWRTLRTSAAANLLAGAAADATALATALASVPATAALGACLRREVLRITAGTGLAPRRPATAMHPSAPGSGRFFRR